SFIYSYVHIFKLTYLDSCVIVTYAADSKFKYKKSLSKSNILTSFVLFSITLNKSLINFLKISASIFDFLITNSLSESFNPIFITLLLFLLLMDTSTSLYLSYLLYAFI